MDGKCSDIPPEGTSVREKIKILFLSDDSPRQIALGLAIGVFVACSPFVGIQTFAALTLALLLRASRLAALLGTLVNNPFTVAFFYIVEFELGSSLLGLPLAMPPNVRENLAELFSIGTKALLSLMVGFLIVGLFASLVTYLIGFWAAVFFRGRNVGKKAT